MPYVNIKVTDLGVTRAQKAELIAGVTRLLQEVLNKDPASTFVLIDEVNTDNWGTGGEQVSERRKRLGH
ncbi:tautomerase family protein [Pseudomonas sp. SP16.1]|uniref:tautomerase family protein n=1 Tax=Pseudomonas sp. SP16.1 TaxID=3458854 RepID=UPI00404574A1